ncbi:MAG TPA: helix-turn-helix domain-containing protein [Candidatus Saccharimonadales bacterium]|nr:helix-turn-helix domain-containing protein [Candidatus Saccharimonadales bacterium]
MDKLVDYLKQLDLSEVEAKLYLTLLQTGPTSVRDLAATIEIKRTTAYFYIDQLVEKGLIMKLVKGSKKLVAATEPENLKVLVESKIASAKSVEKEFPSILNALHTSLPQEGNNTDAEIKYYKGKNGVIKIYEEALKSEKLRSFFNIELIKNSLPDNDLLFAQALENNKDIEIRELLQDTKLSREKVKSSRVFSTNNDRHIYKFLPNGINLSAADILIYDGKVGIVNVQSQFTGIVLKNKDFFNNLKELFDLVWKIVPDNIE